MKVPELVVVVIVWMLQETGTEIAQAGMFGVVMMSGCVHDGGLKGLELMVLVRLERGDKICVQVESKAKEKGRNGTDEEVRVEVFWRFGGY